ncbi:hypothetical protein H8D04_00040 [bacterium]|nr:hypothetical protein [bacterium]
MENTELMKLSKKDLTKHLKNMNSKETMAIYNSLEYSDRMSKNGKLIWDITMRKSGMTIYKNTNRHLI